MSFNVTKALKHRVLVLAGSEEMLIRRATDDLIHEAGLTKDDYDLEILSADSSSVGDWLGSAGTLPFLAPRRIVVLKQAQKLKIEDLPTASLAALPETSLVILILQDDASDDKRGGSKKKSWEKLISACGGAIFTFDADPKAAKEQIKAEILARGKKIQPQALELFTEMVGGSLSRAFEEIDKLVLYTSNDFISEQDIKSVVVASRDWNIWQMIDSITRGDITESLRQLKIVFSNKGKVEDLAFGQLFPLVSRQLRLLFQGRLCYEAGVTPDRPGEVLANFPSKPNLTSVSGYQQNSIMRAARTLTLPQIGQAMQQLAEADARLKGMGASFSGIDTVERLVFDLAATLNPKKA